MKNTRLLTTLFVLLLWVTGGRAEILKCQDSKGAIAVTNYSQCPHGYSVVETQGETRRSENMHSSPHDSGISTQVRSNTASKSTVGPAIEKQSNEILEEELKRLRKQVEVLERRTDTVEKQEPVEALKPYRPPVISSSRGGRYNGGPVGGDLAKVIVNNPNDYSVEISIACRGVAQTSGRLVSARRNYSVPPGHSEHNVPMDVFFFRELTCW